jgi:hypothetical protein
MCVRGFIVDNIRFDQLTRAFAKRPSRRQVLTVLTGVVGIGLTQPSAQARPNRCAVFCASEPKARGADCRQACKACPNPGCLRFDSATRSYTCCGGDPENCLSDGTCVRPCLASTDCSSDCVCIATTEGRSICTPIADLGGGGSCANSCTSSAECDPGQLCLGVGGPPSGTHCCSPCGAA